MKLPNLLFTSYQLKSLIARAQDMLVSCPWSLPIPAWKQLCSGTWMTLIKPLCWLHWQGSGNITDFTSSSKAPMEPTQHKNAFYNAPGCLRSPPSFRWVDHVEKAWGFQSWPCFSLAAGMSFPYSLPAKNGPSAASGWSRGPTAEHHTEHHSVLSQECFKSSWAHRGRANKATLVKPVHNGIAGDRAGQRGKVFTQHLRREAFAQWKNKNMLRFRKAKSFNWHWILENWWEMGMRWQTEKIQKVVDYVQACQKYGAVCQFCLF